MKTAVDLKSAAAQFAAAQLPAVRGRLRGVSEPGEPRRALLAELTDEQLFQRYTMGDGDGFRLLVERYQPRIQGFLRKRLNDEERVEDLTQDTFLRIHRARESYDPARKFSTWIHTIANNLLKNEFRNRSRRRETTFSEMRPEISSSGA